MIINLAAQAIAHGGRGTTEDYMERVSWRPVAAPRGPLVS
jgi:hypothetical protein